ncbi:MAG: NAD(P)-dependent oxidoreductase [Alphaproteobacteria bacterium]|nr:NAD(P)-dependent oxidoreductase [Alphaproteobacteria bacterium]
MAKPTESVAETIAWCGVGTLGRPIVRRLADAGIAPILYDVRAEATAGLDGVGRAAATPAEAASEASLIFSTIPDDDALEVLALGADGLIGGMRPGSVYCDLSTVSPTSSARVAAACDAAGVLYLRAAISGSVALAQAGKLTILASGPHTAFARCEPVFAHFSATRLHVGAAEEARVLKLMINNIAAATTAAVAESIAFGRKGGVDYDIILDVIASSVVASPLIQYKIDPLRRRDFSPTFTTRLMLKDMHILASAAAELGCDLPLGTASIAVFEDQEREGYGDEDFFAGVKMMERRAGLEDL